MNHTLKVIIGFTIMIAIGIGALYFIDQGVFAKVTNGIRSVNTGAGCASTGDC